MNKLSDAIKYDELANLLRNNLNSSNGINNTLMEIDYMNSCVSIPMISNDLFQISFLQSDIDAQIKNCGYKKLEDAVSPYKRHEEERLGQVWNKDSFFEKARGIPFALCFYLLSVYLDRVPSYTEFIQFFIKVACKEVAEHTYQYLDIYGVREPERKNVTLPKETPFSVYDIGVRIYNMLGNFIRELKSAVDICKMLNNMQKTNLLLKDYKFQVVYNSKLDIYNDCDLCIKAIDSAGKMHTVGLSLFDKTKRGETKRFEKESNNTNFRKNDFTNYDVKIKLSADIRTNNKKTLDTIADVYVYNRDVIEVICNSAIENNMFGIYELWGDLTLEKLNN